jgi:hypothetical protein
MKAIAVVYNVTAIPNRALQCITMDNHGYPFGFWIGLDKWLSISDVLQYLFLNQMLSDEMHIA